MYLKKYLDKKKIKQQAKAEKKGIAKKLLKKGLSIEEITEITGLTQEEIKEMETKE